MEQDLISRLIVLAGPLAGAIVGGLISIAAMFTVERQRRRHEKKEKLASLKRETFAAALEWIDPMRNAHSRASSLTIAAIRAEIDSEHLFQEWPNLVGALAKKDLTAAQRALLPDGLYRRGHHIVRELEELRSLGVRHGQDASVMGKLMAGYTEISAKLDAIDAQMCQLEDDLRKEFLTTFE